MLEHGIDRIQIRHCIDLTRAQRRQGAGCGTDADERNIGRLQATLGQYEVGDHVGRRSRRRDADLFALQVGDRLVVRQGLVGDTKDDLRCPALQHESGDDLALALHVDGVLVCAGDDIGAAAHQCLQCLGAAGEVADLHLQSFVLEIAELLGDRQRQVIQQVFTANGDRDLWLFQGLGEQVGVEGEVAEQE